MKSLFEIVKKYKEIIMYLVFGVSTTLVNFILYIIFVNLLQANMMLSNAIAWFVAVAFAFFTNKLFVFESKSFNLKVLAKEMLSFLSARILSGIIEIIGPTLLYNTGFNFSFLGIKGFWSKAVVSIIVILLNYIFSKLFIFKKTDKAGL